MAIKSEFKGGNAMAEGEHVVQVIETKVGMSKSNKPMLTVTFQNDREQKIKGYYVRDLVFHIKALNALKVACGIKPEDAHDNLVGLKCGIKVEPQAPNEQGQIFMQITGYGKEADVEAPADSIPF